MSLASSAHMPNIIWLPSLLLGLFFPRQNASILQSIVTFLHLEGFTQKEGSVQPVRESRTIRRRLMRDKQRAKQPPFAAMTALWGIWHLFTTTISTTQQQYGKRKRYHTPSCPGQAVVLQKVNSEPEVSTEGDLAVDQSAQPKAYRPSSCVSSLLSWLNIPAACWTLAPPGTWTSSATVVPHQTESSSQKGQSNKKKSGKNGKKGKKESKQQRGKDKKNNSGDDDDSQPKKSHSDSVGGGSSQTGQLWACPYYKFDPERHRACADHRVITQQRHVKLHLIRFHKMKDAHLCPTCGIKFEKMEKWLRHIKAAQNCSLYSGPYKLFPDELDFDMIRKSTDEEKWFHRWDILFSGYPRPLSPYVGNDEEERQSRFRHRLRQRFPNGTVVATVEEVLQICFSEPVCPNPRPRRRPAVVTPEHQVSAATQSPGTDMQTLALTQIWDSHEPLAADISALRPENHIINDVFMGADAQQLPETMGPPTLNATDVPSEGPAEDPSETDSMYEFPNSVQEWLPGDFMDMTDDFYSY